MIFKVTWVRYNNPEMTDLVFAKNKAEAEELKINLETLRHVSDVKIEEVT